MIAEGRWCWEKKQSRNHDVYRESGILLTVYHHLLKGEHRGNPRCSLPSVPISSSLFCRPWLSQPFPKLPSISSTCASPHDHQYYECSPIILLLHLPPICLKSPPFTMNFLWHSWDSCPSNLYSCCHFWVTSGLSDRNDCSCSCPLHIVRKRYRNKNTKYIYS